MSKPNVPRDSTSSPEDDPTGVHELLSGLPEPDPMPSYLVQRITMSLNAEQSQRAARFSGDLATPLVATKRRRTGRVLFALAGAAAVVLVAVVGTSLLKTNQTGAGSTTSFAAADSTGQQGAGAKAQQPGTDRAVPGVASAPALIQIRTSGTRYKSADFAAQARGLDSAAFSQPEAAKSLGGRVETSAGLTACLQAVGVVDATTVWADVAFYEGQPAVIIVARTSKGQIAYALGRECSLTDAAVLHPATPLP
ncbi:MAG: hypothetical protein ABI662_08975 [Dermatophilaceae bacterium]